MPKRAYSHWDDAAQLAYSDELEPQACAIAEDDEKILEQYEKEEEGDGEYTFSSSQGSESSQDDSSSESESSQSSQDESSSQDDETESESDDSSTDVDTNRELEADEPAEDDPEDSLLSLQAPKEILISLPL
ncbi:hypothetical protein CVT24_000546 [Panaeolus cyanescens]|uniref:Uncharacterized protein n=1 Tax=Panaeolus cyanescens TaxID=181874 RepID=A0A409V8I2_9AGAR|nr:hypothetical protein CVT24_000546 [Panaeolus cyanescens]